MFHMGVPPPGDYGRTSIARTQTTLNSRQTRTKFPFLSSKFHWDFQQFHGHLTNMRCKQILEKLIKNKSDMVFTPKHAYVQYWFCTFYAEKLLKKSFWSWFKFDLELTNILFARERAWLLRKPLPITRYLFFIFIQIIKEQTSSLKVERCSFCKYYCLNMDSMYVNFAVMWILTTGLFKLKKWIKLMKN